MRRLLTVVTAGLLAVAGPAFAQNAQPVLIGQGSPATTTTSSQSSGEDALAQFPNQQNTIFNNPLLIAGLITAAIAIPIAIAVSSNDSDQAASP